MKTRIKTELGQVQEYYSSERIINVKTMKKKIKGLDGGRNSQDKLAQDQRKMKKQRVEREGNMGDATLTSSGSMPRKSTSEILLF